MKINIKKLNNTATIPKRANPGDAGLDLVATTYKYEDGCFVYGTDLAIEIPKGYVGLIIPRSSISKTNFYLLNSVGVIDSSYRGELIMKFGADVEWYMGDDNFPKYHDGYTDNPKGTPLKMYEVGDRIGQLVIIPYMEDFKLEEVKELSKTKRGSGGFGSTGL